MTTPAPQSKKSSEGRWDRQGAPRVGARKLETFSGDQRAAWAARRRSNVRSNQCERRLPAGIGRAAAGLPRCSYRRPRRCPGLAGRERVGGWAYLIGLDRWPPTLAMLGTRRELQTRARELKHFTN